MLESIAVALGAPASSPATEAWLLEVLANLQESLQRQKRSLVSVAWSETPAVREAAGHLISVLNGAGAIAANAKAPAEERQAAVRLLAGSTNQSDLTTLVSIAMQTGDAAF